MLGSWEIILIIFFILVLFGPSKISQILNNLKLGMIEFKNSVSNIEDTK